MLLHTAGDLLFSADDDTVCRPALAPDGADGLACSAAYDPTEFFFFTRREQAQAAVRASDVDVLETHERLLGRRPGRVAADVAGDHVDLDGASPRFLTSVANTVRAKR